ncbi:MAG: VWA domain-containing protein, partial [Anaerolineae bacterium]|nr:VWA domain-containing protein [Anaerolineae bacterium]
KIELAKEAILRSIQLLGPADRLGVLAFDESASWVVPLGDIGDRGEASRLVGTLRAGGGTDIDAGVLAVSRALPDDPGRLRHIVLLTDGGASEEGIPELVSQMYDDYGITMSVIAIGQGYAPFLEGLPRLADGRFHFAYNTDTIPEIFSEETVIATRAYIIEGEFYPALTSTSPIMNGISTTPPLRGYIGTTIKPTAQQILVIGDYDDPLLAAWQYGLGRSVAWTSDATGRWAQDWAGWDEYARFWSQAVRWTITEGAASSVEVQVRQEGEQVRVIVDAKDDEGAFLNGLDMQANVVSPDLSGTPLALQQVAPGRYEGVFTPGLEGAYFVRVAGVTAQADGGAAPDTAVAQTSGWVLSYSPEYRSFEGNPEYLAFIAGLTGGSVIDDPGAIFTHNLRVEAAFQPVWPFLLLFAVILLPFDIAVRRLIITPSDLARLRTIAFPKAAAAAAQPRTSRVGTLFAAKERAGQAVDQRRVPGAGPAGSMPEPPTTPAAPNPEIFTKSRPSAAPTGGSVTASSLLARKRARRGEEEKDER